MSTISPRPVAAPIAAAGVPKVNGQLADALNNVSGFLAESLRNLQSIPNEHGDDPAVTPVRKAAYDANMKAQDGLAFGFNSPTTPAEVSTLLHEADASLEFANWKTVGQDPNTKTHIGVDVFGAIADTQHAVALVQDLLGQTGGAGPTPPTPPSDRLGTTIGAAQTAIGQSLALLRSVPADSAQDPRYTPVRKQAYDANMTAQNTLATQFDDPSISQDQRAALHAADAHLETAQWHTVGKDPNTHGAVPIDINGSIAETEAASQVLAQLAGGPVQQPAPGSGQPPAASPGNGGVAS